MIPTDEAGRPLFAVGALPDRPEFGAMVTGLSRSAIDRPDVRIALVELWIDRGLIVFRGLDPDEEFHVALSEVFGKPDIHPILRDKPGQHPVLTDIRHDREGSTFDIRGEVRGAWLPWHSDLIYVDRINRGGILRALTIPETGGETGFVDRIVAYQRLPQQLRERIADLSVLYYADFDTDRQRFGRDPEVRMLHRGSEMTRAHKTARYRSIHPMVFTQPETGRKVLNVSPWFAQGIEGMETPDGDALLEEVMSYAVPKDLAYFHPWRPGDMVLWDNWRMLHSAAGVPVEQERLMQRTTLHGDYALGRLEQGPGIEPRLAG